MSTKLSEIVRGERLAQGYPVKVFLKKLADLGVKLSSAYITKIEKYNEIPTPYVIRKIAQVIEIEEEYLLNVARKNKIKAYAKKINKMYKA